MCLYKRDLSQQIEGRIGVQWGHEMPTLSADELKIAGAWATLAHARERLFARTKNSRERRLHLGHASIMMRCALMFKKWRKKAQEGRLKLGGLVSAASQLPLFVMRKPQMVDILFNDGYFQPKDIGVVNADQIQWKIFYDVDDMLGFPTRRMYRPDDAILEVQVDSGDDPGTAHTAY
jgi:hypothetical protein